MAKAWVRIATAMKKSYDLVDEANDLRGRVQGADKLFRAKDGKDREKAVREVLGIDAPLSDAINAASEARDDLTEIAHAKIEWPGCDGGDAYADVAMAAYRHGADSKQVRAAWAAYGAHLKAFEKIVKIEIQALEDIKDQLPLRKKAAGQLVDISRALKNAFENALKLPLPSAVQARVFTLSEDTGLLYAQALNVQKLLEQIEAKVKAELEIGDALLDANATWIGWAAKGAGRPVEQIKKNAKAKLPR